MADEEHAVENDGWLFLADCSIFSITAVCTTLLTIIWMKYGYFKYTLVPKTQTPKTPQSDNSSGVESDNSTNNFKIQKAMTSQKKYFKGRLYITLSIICAMMYCYHNVLYEILRIFKILKPSIIRNNCSIPVLSIIWHSLNRLFLYLYFIWRIAVSFT
eukprot:357565_1